MVNGNWSKKTMATPPPRTTDTVPTATTDIYVFLITGNIETKKASSVPLPFSAVRYVKYAGNKAFTKNP